MTTVPRQTTSPTRTSELLAVLREDVLSGSLEPGAPLRLTALRERYAVGLTPLREALFQLAAEGLVTLHDQRGFRVAQVSQAELADLTEQRVLVEGQALRLSVERGDLAWEGRVLAAAHLLSGTTMLGPDGATPTAAWSEAHRDFHRVLVEACGSVWLLRLRSTLFDHAERYRRWSVRRHPGRDVEAEHRGLAAAALARDAELAVSLLAAHYCRTAKLCDLPADTAG